MSLFEFCLEIIRREGKRFNVGVNTATASQITAATASDVNFDIAHNRCSFLYRCGAINLHFAKDCFKKCLSDEKSMVFLLSKWIKCENLTVCSIGKGPALDYIALLLSYQECGVFPPLFKNIKLITKYGAWRNTVNFMFEILNEEYLTGLQPESIGNIEVIQGDPFLEFTEKVKQPIGDSDIILMVKTLNLQADGYDKVRIAQLLQEFLATLKPGSILFCIDTKPSVGAITHQLCSFAGSFLFEPTHMTTTISLNSADFYKDIFGCFPVVSARGSFFVWQKGSTVSAQKLDCLIDEVSESVKRLLTVNNVQNDCSSKSLEENCSEQKVDSTFANASENQTFLDVSKIMKAQKPNNTYHESALSSGNTSCSFKEATLPQRNLTTQDVGLNKKSSNNSNLINRAVQTEPEEDFKEPGQIKISDLSDRIAKLTTTLNEMLQTSESEECKSDNCLKNLEKGQHYAPNDCIHNHTPPTAQSDPCKEFSESAENYCTACRCCQKRAFENYQSHVCRQEQSTLNQYGSSSSLNSGFDATRYNNSCHNRLNLATENISVPKLVIPLNNLSGNVVSQILSIISQSNQEQ